MALTRNQRRHLEQTIISQGARTAALATGSTLYESGRRWLFGSNPRVSIPRSRVTHHKHNNALVREETGVSDRHPAVVSHKKKGVTLHKSKEAHVDKKFRMKVLKAMEEEGESFHGSWTQFSFGGIEVDSSAFAGDHKQLVFTGTNLSTGDFTDWLGSATDMVHCASVLWNGKADNQSVRNINDYTNLGSNTNDSNLGNVALPNEPYGSNHLQFLLKNSYDDYQFKNNSRRTITLKAYEVAPKVLANSTDALLRDSAASGAAGYAMVPYVVSPPTVWADGLISMKNETVNVSATEIDSMGLDPRSTPEFSRCFKTALTTIILEPGQTYNYFLQGPSNLHVNTADYWMGTVFVDVQKFARNVMFVAHLDLVSDSANNAKPTRRGNVSDVGGALIFEKKRHYSFIMPGNVGMKITRGVTATTASLQLNYRQNKFFVATYGRAGNAGTRYDEENPANVENL